MQLLDTSGMQLGPNPKCELKCNQPIEPAQCPKTLRRLCVGANQSAVAQTLGRLQLYNVPNGGRHVSPQNCTDYTAEFLLTRGPYAMIGYSWHGCTSGDRYAPRPKEWDDEYGEPMHNGAACKETSAGSGVVAREWTTASVQWDCSNGHGKIAKK